MKVRWWQRNYVIDPNLQLKIVGMLAGIALIMAAVVIYIAYSKVNELGVFFNRSFIPQGPIQSPYKEMSKQLMVVMISVCISFFFVLAAVVKIISEKSLSFTWLAISLSICGGLILAAAYGGIVYFRILHLGAEHPAVSVIMPVAKEEAFQIIATSLLFNLVAVVTGMIIVFSGAGIMLTHRIAGPIWRLQTELKKHLKGEVIQPLKFRKNDEFQELADLINILIEKLKQKST